MKVMLHDLIESVQKVGKIEKVELKKQLKNWLNDLSVFIQNEKRLEVSLFQKTVSGKLPLKRRSLTPKLTTKSMFLKKSSRIWKSQFQWIDWFVVMLATEKLNLQCVLPSKRLWAENKLHFWRQLQFLQNNTTNLAKNDLKNFL